MEEHWRSLLREAYRVAGKESNDPSTQNGALIINREGRVLVSGWNRLPPGIAANPDRLMPPLKDRCVVHAEQAVICEAARKGVALAGLTLVCPWAACVPCACAIISAGIARLVMHEDAFRKTPYRSRDEVIVARNLFFEAGVEVISCSGAVNDPRLDKVKIRFDGAVWYP